MKKLPNGISNYEEIIEDGYYYVDKTKYIEKLENLNDKRVIYLRPRKFGKTLFTSMIENYYDKNKKHKFEKLYSKTYIGKNPTKLRNSYSILKFNFSGIDTQNEETTMNGFKREVASSIQLFVNKYELNFYVNQEDEPEIILDNLIKAFYIQKKEEKIYVIIDEYDQFANELLGFRPEKFKDLVSKNGKVRKLYEILKKGTETIIDRIFITGVAPITLDSLTSGFNIGLDISKDIRFNEMTGFTKEELITLMNEQRIEKEEQEKILPIMKENYDGYNFSIKSTETIYNSNMCLYFLNYYVTFNEIPNQLIDLNIASDYSKLGRMLELCQSENRRDIIEKTVSGKKIISDITEKFNPVLEFTDKDLISMLYYLGYLTITGENFGMLELNIPNNVMKELYAEYFMKILKKETDFNIQEQDYNTMAKEIATEGKIDTIIQMVQTYLENLSNRDYIQFSEKYIKLIFYCIAMNLKIYRVKTEMEVQRRYIDLLLIPKDMNSQYYSIIIEFKYLKKDEEDKLKETQMQAKEQIEGYSKLEEIKALPKLNKYTVIAVNDKLYVEKI